MNKVNVLISCTIAAAVMFTTGCGTNTAVGPQINDSETSASCSQGGAEMDAIDMINGIYYTGDPSSSLTNYYDLKDFTPVKLDVGNTGVIEVRPTLDYMREGNIDEQYLEEKKNLERAIIESSFYNIIGCSIDKTNNDYWIIQMKDEIWYYYFDSRGVVLKNTYLSMVTPDEKQIVETTVYASTTKPVSAEPASVQNP